MMVPLASVSKPLPLKGAHNVRDLGGYPFTREAAYLANTYANVWVDVGEVFPCLSRRGQENVFHGLLELAPWSKILAGTDGHYFPETYYLAQTQVREVLETVRSSP